MLCMATEDAAVLVAFAGWILSAHGKLFKIRKLYSTTTRILHSDALSLSCKDEKQLFIAYLLFISVVTFSLKMLDKTM